MGSNPSKEYCPEIVFSGKNDLQTTLIPNVVLFVVNLLALWLLVLFVAVIPWNRIHWRLGWLQDKVVAGLGVLDFNVAIVPQVLRVKREGDIKIIKNAGEYQSIESKRSGEGDAVVGQYMDHDLTVHTKAVGGCLTLSLLVVIFWVLLTGIISYKGLVSYNLQEQAIPLSVTPEKESLYGRFKNVPCGSCSELQLQELVNDEWVNIKGVTCEQKKGFCEIQGGVEVFNAKLWDNERNFIPIEKSFKLSGYKVSHGNDFIDVAIFSPMVDSNPSKTASRKQAFFFTDSCRRTQVSPSEGKWKIYSTMALRKSCIRLYGSAINCDLQNLAIGNYDKDGKVGASVGTIEVYLRLSDQQINTIMDNKSDLVVFTFVVTVIMSSFVVHPLLKQFISKVIVSVLLRLKTGEGIGIFSSLKLGVKGIVVFSSFSALFLAFVSEVFLDYEARRPEYSFNGSIFSGEAQFKVLNFVVGVVLIALTIIFCIIWFICIVLFLGLPKRWVIRWKRTLYDDDSHFVAPPVGPQNSEDSNFNL